MAHGDILVLQSESQRVHCLCLTLLGQYASASASCPMTTSRGLQGDSQFVRGRYTLSSGPCVAILSDSLQHRSSWKIPNCGAGDNRLDPGYLSLSHSILIRMKDITFQVIIDGLEVDRLRAQIERGVLRPRPRFEYQRSKMGGR